MLEEKLKAGTKKRGNRLGVWFFKISLRFFGLSGAYGLLYLVCPYYLIFDRPTFSASMAYINRRYRGHGFLRRIYYVYKLLINQGKNLVDRFYVVSGQGQFNMQIQWGKQGENLLNDPQQGIILLTAHVGNWQVTMTALEKLKRTIYLQMRPEENIAIKDILGIDDEQERIKIISPENFLGGVIEMVNAINQGGLVSIMGDRTYGADSVEAYFLGDAARFPYGAFSLAASVGCPVVVLLSVKVSRKTYFVYVADVIEPRYSSKQKKLQEIEGWVQWFARILEDYVTKYPFQWFVFDDIWREKDTNRDKL
jgi:predicted LPLAT superfamily acyltransferase